jgi:hypothetical protein
MLPLAVGTGPGSEERRAVAIVVIGGQTMALLLTLLVTPVAYSFFDDFGQLVRRVRGGGGPGPGEPDTGVAEPPVAHDEPPASLGESKRPGKREDVLEPAGV